MKNNELVSYCKDLLKIFSDDAIYEDGHILFIASKMRALLLRKYYDTPKKVIPQSNYQTICLDLTYSDDYNVCGTDDYLMSSVEVPDIMEISRTSIYTINYFTGMVEMVPKERFKYIGGNKYMRNIIYATLGPDNHIYLKSANKQFLSLQQIKLTAVFEDANRANELSCDVVNSSDGEDITNAECDELERDFPIEESLIPELLEYIIKSLAGGILRPMDNKNDGVDNLSEIQNYINNIVKERFKNNE